MEMLVVSSQNRNQCYSRSKPQIPDGFGSSSPRGFKGINCRAFQSGIGILPSPSVVTPSYATPSSSEIKKSRHFHSEPTKSSLGSNPIPIVPKTPPPKETTFIDDLAYSELWAGPAYSNSPPPSSLPIPKFSLRQNRSISLELPAPSSKASHHPIARSAPPSPTRDSRSSDSDSDLELFFTADSATQNLRRILHLEIADD